MTDQVPALPSYPQPNVTPKGVPLITDNHKYAKPLTKLAFQMMRKGKTSPNKGKVHITHRKIKWA